MIWHFGSTLRTKRNRRKQKLCENVHYQRKLEAFKEHSERKWNQRVFQTILHYNLSSFYYFSRVCIYTTYFIGIWFWIKKKILISYVNENGVFVCVSVLLLPHPKAVYLQYRIVSISLEFAEYLDLFLEICENEICRWTQYSCDWKQNIYIYKSSSSKSSLMVCDAKVGHAKTID